MSEIYKISEIRQILLEELKDYYGKPILLPYNGKFLQMVVFDKNDKGYYFSSEMIEVLRKIDFTNIPFDGVSQLAYDCSNYYGIHINPQTLATNDMCGRNFAGVTFIGGFENKLIAGSIFKGSKGALINPQSIQIVNYSHDLSDIDFADVTFEGNFEKCIITNSSFKGSGGAKINPQTIAKNSDDYHNLSGIDFADVTFEGNFEKCIITNSSFKGSKGAVINPQTIATNSNGYHDLSSVDFADVAFKGNFKNCIIKNSSFKGSNDAIINVDMLTNKCLKNCNFDSVTLTGNFDGADIEGANFEGSNYHELEKFSNNFRAKIKTLKKEGQK